jgi:Abnormal spindle-like microcephaly-assoc'd, ASPM-SPD-2-Hydin
MRTVGLACLFSLLSTMAIAQSVQGPRGAVNFQNVNVCAAGQKTPKPCTRTSKVNYTVASTTTFGATQVVTQGVANLDFTLNATTCTGTLSAGSSCYVRVAFSPRAAGVRMGAVELADSLGNLLASTYIYGNGQAPVAAFNPGTQADLPVSGDGGAMAVDAAGDVYFSANGSIAKFDPQTGTQTIVATGVPSFAIGLAVDGAGNLFVSDGGLARVAADTGVVTMLGPNLNSTAGVAVDGRGNIYVGDDWDNPVRGQWGWPRLAEIFAATGEQQTLLTGYYADQGNPAINFPWGVAVDSAGNAFIAGANFGPVFESIAGTPPESDSGVFGSHQFATVGEFFSPFGVAADAAGDVYVTDGNFNPNGIYQVPAGGGSQIQVVSGPWEVSIATDAAANLFFPTNAGLGEMNASVPAVLDFGKVAVGSTSAPQSITIQNVGNQPLNAVAPGLVIGTNFLQVPGSGAPADCTSAFSLAPGASCNLSMVFAPQVVGKINGTATFTDNALNAIPSVSQGVVLKGVGQ